MGTYAEIQIFGPVSAKRARAALIAARAELHAVDRLMAVQRPHSDVSRLNCEGARHPVRVDVRVIEVLTSAMAMHALTAGAFDVTVLPVVRAWGFIDGHPRAPDAGVRHAIAGTQTLRIDPGKQTVAFTDTSTQVDLGGIAKGYALDRVRDALRRHDIHSAFLDLGGSIATLGRPPDGPHWRIGVKHPRRAGEILGVITMDDAAVSTSGDAEQFVIRDGRRFGHIIDPRTGNPASALASATVIASSATAADALSTAAVVLGERGIRPALAAVDAAGVFAAVAPDGAIRVTSSAATGVSFEQR
jgi:thiamine biosynthesis lipoprotein